MKHQLPVKRGETLVSAEIKKLFHDFLPDSKIEEEQHSEQCSSRANSVDEVLTDIALPEHQDNKGGYWSETSLLAVQPPPPSDTSPKRPLLSSPDVAKMSFPLSPTPQEGVRLPALEMNHGGGTNLAGLAAEQYQELRPTARRPTERLMMRIRNLQIELKKEKMYREQSDKKLGMVRRAHQVELRNLHYKVFYTFQAKYHKKVESMCETFKHELHELRD